MKAIIECESQEEFDEKRAFLAKALLGEHFDCVIKARPRTIYSAEKPALTKREPPIKAQGQIVDYWNSEFSKMIAAIKEDINAIIRD